MCISHKIRPLAVVLILDWVAISRACRQIGDGVLIANVNNGSS
jgi:hypothetical protein